MIYKKFACSTIVSFLINLSTCQGSIGDEFIEIDCSFRSTNFSAGHQKKQNEQEAIISHIDCIQGARPHAAFDLTTQTRSLNWCGYATLTNLDDPENNSVENVLGTWTVPTLSSTPNNAYSVAWVGIDGYFDNETSVTVEQIGTAHFWIDGAPVYFAWFEMYGPITSGGLNEISNFPVNPGDVITAQVKYVGNSVFDLRIYNITQQVFTKIPQSMTFQPLAARTSAEWIVEAPTDSSTGDILPLANFGVIEFKNCKATIGRKKGAINNKHWQKSVITMVSSVGGLKSSPSALDCQGKAFSLTWIGE